MKKIISLMLTFVLLLSMLPVNVFAESVEISDVEELNNVFISGGTAVLNADIGLNDYLNLENDVILDLNGHKIAVTEEEMSGSIIVSEGKSLTVRDSKGGGGITSENWIDISVENGKLILESGYVQNILVTGGTFEMKGGEAKQVQFDNINDMPVIIKSETAKVEKWVCGIGTLNFDPTEYLLVGFIAVNNGDGTYTTKYDNIEKTGENITIYYDGIMPENGEYQLSEDGKTPPEALDVEVMYVNNGESVLIPMKKCDNDGKKWTAEIDKAYIGAEMHIMTGDGMIATFLTKVPDKSGLTYNSDGEWISGDVAPKPTEAPSSETPLVNTPSATAVSDATDAPENNTTENNHEKDNSGSMWIWFSIGAVAVIAVFVAVIVIIKKKK